MSGDLKLRGLALMILGFLLSSCARPIYNNVSSHNPGETVQGESAADCSLRFRSSNYCLSWRWEQKPTETQVGSLIFKVYRANLLDQTPVEVDFASAPQVNLWMPSMGHGSSPTSVNRLDVGTYRASEVFFIMPGDWEIRFQVKDGNQVSDDATVSLVI